MLTHNFRPTHTCLLAFAVDSQATTDLVVKQGLALDFRPLARPEQQVLDRKVSFDSC